LNEISIPYHLLIPSIISILGLASILLYRKKLFSKNKQLWTSLIIFITVYLLVVGNAAFDDIYYQWDLNRYDLDKDGFFGGQEITKDQEAAMQRLTNDVGRNFSFITGFLMAFVISLTYYFLSKLNMRTKNSNEGQKNHT